MINSQRGRRTVDLCIYVDNNAYSPDVDKEQLFDALYNIAYSVSFKHKMLPKFEDYEPFALFAASKLYMRLTNPKQFLPDDDPKKLKKVKSILNLLKAMMYPMVVDYQQENYAQRFSLEDERQDLVETAKDLRHEVVKSVSKQYTDILRIDFEYYLKKICNTIKGFLKTTPYAEDKVTFHNLYLSCLMTFINQITLCNANKERLQNKLDKGYRTDDFINRIYKEEQLTSVVVFHLPPSMYNYVSTLVCRIRKLIINDLRDLVGAAQPTDAVVQAVMSSSLETGNDSEQY